MSHHAYFDESGTELSLVQVHRHPESAERHMRIARELIGRGVALTRPIRIAVYGEPGPIVRQALEANRGQGAQVVVADRPDLGFTRGS